MINEIKKYKERGLNNSQIARVLKVSRNTVKKYIKRLSMEPSGLQQKPFQAAWSEKVDWTHVVREKNLGMQLAHYWEQYIESQHEEINYVGFWREFRRRYPSIKLDMRQSFIPGERCEFDYKGKDIGFGFISKETGEFTQCRLFGMVLPASQLFFARATLTEKQEDVFESIARGFKSFGGVTSTIVFDNAKVQVTKADNYDPQLNSEFSLFCDQYNLAPLAARPGKPKDKSLIENSLGVFWRWAWPQLRKVEFFSLAEVNKELCVLLKRFNNRLQKKYGLSRQQRFESYEKKKLKSLPANTYEAGFWKKVKVHPDCHVQISQNFFSVPFQYRGKYLNVRINRQTFEIFHELERVAIHKAPMSSRGRYFTNDSHLPESQQALLEKTPQNLITEALAVGPSTGKIVSRLLKESRHPLMYLRRVQGILRLKRRYSKTGLEEASLFFINVSLSDIKVGNLEQVITAKTKVPRAKKINRQPNENLRGELHWAETYH